MSDYGDRLQLAMIAGGLSETELARRVDCTPQYISQLVKGEREPNEEMFQAIAHALSAPPDMLRPPSASNPRRTRRPELRKAMPGVEIAYLTAAMEALREARRIVLKQSPENALRHGFGKSDTYMFDAMAENTIIEILRSFNEHAVVLTEETNIAGNINFANHLTYFVDPFDRSKPFVETLRKSRHATIEELVYQSDYGLQGLSAPFASITCVRDTRIIFNAMIDYVSGDIFVACAGMLKHCSIERCPDPDALAKEGEDIVFAPRDGDDCMTYVGSNAADDRKAQLYRKLYNELGLGAHRLPETNGLSPGGPGRILYLCDDPDLVPEPKPGFILSNGERICEWLGWLAYAIYSRELAAYELYAEKFEARNKILLAPPPDYSLFTPLRAVSRGLTLNLRRITGWTYPSQYRAAIAVTHVGSTGVCAELGALMNSRELLPHTSRPFLQMDDAVSSPPTL